MITKKQPEFAPVQGVAAAPVAGAALDWFQQFLKHLEINFADTCHSLASESDWSDYRLAAMRAIRLALLDSGMPRESLLELFGQVAVEDASAGHVVGWTVELNKRRFELIDRDIQRTLSPAEQIELAGLTALMREHVDSEVNLPMDGAKALHRFLIGSVTSGTDQ
jgi:hypothetical protein